MRFNTRGVLVTGEDTCIEAKTIERTRRRVSSAMFVSFGVSLGGAVGPIEDGTDVFAGRYRELAALHMHDGHDGRHDLYMWSTQPAKACVTIKQGNSSIGSTTLRPGAPRVGSMVHQQVSLPVENQHRLDVYIFGGSTPPRVHVETSQPAKTPA